MSDLQFGFGKRDITPRVGVELAGYGAYLHRYSTEVRDPLECRAMALRCLNITLIHISCDLGSVNLDISHKVRQHLSEQHGIPMQQIMVQATHTHSGPSVHQVWLGWGEPDDVYVETLPHRIIEAANQALADLAAGEIRYAAAPCTGIAINREYDVFSMEHVDEIKSDTWQANKPELTDQTCHVLSFFREDKLCGIVSSYGCHPVIGGPKNTHIHGDWPGLASHQLEQEFPGSRVLFLQGAQGDINAAITAAHGERMEQALQILSTRYAKAISNGVKAGKKLEVSQLSARQSLVQFSRIEKSRDAYLKELHELETLLARADADENDNATRIAMVKLGAVRHFLVLIDQGGPLNEAIEIQGFGIGPLRFLCAPFEIQRQIKLDTVSQSMDQHLAPIILSFCNNSYGYAIDDTVAARGGYAVDLTPYIHRQLPFAHIHQELTQSLVDLDRRLCEAGHRAAQLQDKA